MEQKNNIIIVFEKEADSALLDIEKKYKLEEGDGETIKKIKEDKPFRINILANLIREFASGNISEKNFIDSLQNDLDINKETAEKIFKDIATNIIPFLIKTSEEEIEKGVLKNIENRDNEQTQKIEVQPTKLREFDNAKNIKKMKQPMIENKQNIIKEKIEKTEKSTKKEDKKNQTDIYREPIG